VREKLAARDRSDDRDRPVLDLAWEYPTEGPTAEPSAEAVLREINGWNADGALKAYTELRADGSTACGCWIYCGCYAEETNQAARRKSRHEQGPVAPEWGWAWPANRRILYNRASADPDGKPWSERKRYVWWDAGQGRWVGDDVPDFEPTKPPSYVPPDGARAEAAIAGKHPFIMQSDGRGWLFAPAGLVDGPLPTHYEPSESPFANRLYGQSANPARQRLPDPRNRSHPSDGEPGAEAYPYIFTTYRLTEQHTAGGMSRFLPYLTELQPAMFCEVGPELARERQLEHGGWATISTARAVIEARVMVTERMGSLVVSGRRTHQIGLPYHWGSRGLTRGDSANELVAMVLDPNVHIQESKVATCDIRPGRRREHLT
jgi:formate dehydrogenase major subunit